MESPLSREKSWRSWTVERPYKWQVLPKSRLFGAGTSNSQPKFRTGTEEYPQRPVSRFHRAQLFGASGPFRVEAHAIIEGLLSSHARRRQSRIQIGALHGLGLRNSVGKEHRKAANERVAGSRTVDAFHGKGWHMLAAFTTCKKRSFRA